MKTFLQPNAFGLTRGLTLVLLLFLAFVARAQAQSLFGTNLILNGDAEAGPASTGGSAPGGIVLVPYWTSSNTFTVTAYGSTTATHLVPLSAPGPLWRGNNYFAGGPTNGNCYATQDRDISTAAVQIDSGTVQYFLSGYFGGFHRQDDYALLTVFFLDDSNATLGSDSVGHVMSADRTDSTSVGSLLLRKALGIVPAGTRKLHFLLSMIIDPTLPNNAYNDGYSDNLSFLMATPDNPGAPLSIVMTKGILRLQWPTSLTGFNLQTAFNLQPPVTWATVTNPVAVDNGWFMITNATVAPAQFFRLTY
jgi:hypothetical protein